MFGDLLSNPDSPPLRPRFTHHTANLQRRRRSSTSKYAPMNLEPVEGSRRSSRSRNSLGEALAAPALVAEVVGTPAQEVKKTPGSKKRSGKKSSSKKVSVKTPETVVEEDCLEPERPESVVFFQVAAADLMAEGIAPVSVEPELERLEAATASSDLVMDAETAATAAATAALYEAALSFAQPKKQARQHSDGSSSSVASTPVRRSSSLLLPTASSSVKKRSFPVAAAALTSSSVPDMTSTLSTPLQAWRPSSAKPTLTVPKSPRLRVDQRSRSCARPMPVSTDEREAALVAEETRKLHEQLRRNKEEFERARSSAASAKETSQVRSTKTLTVPTTPCFLLSKKKGPKIMSNTAAAPLGTQEDEAKPKKLNFDEVVASAGAAGAYVGPKKPTIFEPFKFATDARASIARSSSAAAVSENVIVPAAELAAKFLRDARVYDVSTSKATSTANKKPTVPVSPRLSKRVSSHPRPLSTEEREAALMQEIQQHAFKAKPVNKRVFASSGDMGVPKVAVKSATAVIEFSLRTDIRSAARAATAAAEKAAAIAATPSTAFKARPMPNFAETGPNNNNNMLPPSTPSFKPTVAVSPKFSVKHGASAPARRQLPHHTVMEHSKAEALMLSRGLAQHGAAGERTKLTLTEPAPFALQSVARHEESVAQFEAVLKQVEKKMKEVAFHAMPLPKTTYEAPPQTPKPSECGRTPLIPVDVHLQSQVRAAKRAEFDQKVAEQVVESTTKKAQDKAALEEQENIEVAKLRRMSTAKGGLQFVAQPVNYKDVYPTKHVPPQPPTQPKSPFLLTKQRAALATNVSSQ